jgi:methionine sulfoxide reductase heme-binding subunit
MLLLTATVVLGIMHSMRWSPKRTPRFVMSDVHRNVSLLVLVFIVIHVATAVLDGFAPIRWLDAIMPVGGSYRPIWLGLGALSFDILLAVAITSLLRSRMGFGTWRAIHWTAYGCWAVAIFHGIGIGSDTKQLWMQVLVAASIVAVLSAIAWRVAAGWSTWTLGRVSMALTAAVLPIVLVVWMFAGPLRPGWAKAAGTPTRLLGTGSTSKGGSGSGSSAGSGPVVALVLPPQTRISGQAQLNGSSAGGSATLSIQATSASSPSLRLDIEIKGSEGEQGFSVASGTVVLTPPDGAAVYRGTLTSLQGSTIIARLSDGQGDQIGTSIAMSITPSGVVSGELSIQRVSAALTGSGTARTGEGGE